jgi:uncharacterized protein YndB with AHSA1/START domain
VNKTITPAPVRRAVTVKVSQARAFEVFTSRAGTWWPKSHHIGKVEPETVVIEPRVGGRWFERAPDGTECDLGRVLAWEPPSRLLLGWQLNLKFQYQPDLITEVELRFIAEGAGTTRVELEHRNLERFGDDASAMRERIDRGWPFVLDTFAAAAGR